MKNISANDISSIKDVKKIGADTHQIIQYLLIDSRKLIFPSGTLFFAIKTSSNDGHLYIDELYQKGVRMFVVSVLPDISHYADATFFITTDVVGILQSLAAQHRKQFS